MKTISCAVIFMTPDKKILLGHITGQNGIYDIPKGMIENNETPKNTAARELYEETGIVIDPDNLIDYGIRKYYSKKDLHVFMYHSKHIINLQELQCTSYFSNNKGEQLPEINGYILSSINDLSKYIRPKLLKVLQSILNI